MSIIYHLIRSESWEAAKSAGSVEPESLVSEGFIHCSENEDQVLAVAHRLYAGIAGMLVLELDTNLLDSPVKREAGSSGEMYPHIYGPLNVSAVVEARAMETSADGGFILPS